MSIAPPLGICTGVVEPAEVFGGFGPVPGLVGAWRGACIGNCGGRPMCAAELPAPECSGCGRVRHRLPADTPRVPWRPAVHALGTDWRPAGSLPVPAAELLPDRWAILRPATEISPHDPSLPRTVLRSLIDSAPGLRVFVAVAADAAGNVLASVSVRAPGVGYVVYERPEGGAWRYARGAVLAPRPRHRLPARLHLMRANVGRFTAALLGEEYDPTPVADVAESVRAAAARGTCPGCGAEVSLTKAGAVYASHKCQTRAIEGRS